MSGPNAFVHRSVPPNYERIAARCECSVLTVCNVHVMTLPSAKDAIIDIAKLRDYCLNPNHPRGKHKARVFEKALGYTQEDAEELRTQIKDLIVSSPCEIGRKDQYGQRYKVEITIRRKGKGAIVLRAWILKMAEQAPRLTTCYVK